MKTLDGKEQENFYDGEGLRAGLIENGRKMTFLYHNGEILTECDGESAPVRRHIRGIGLSCVQTIQDNAYHSYHQDEQGSTAYITGQGRKTENIYQYDAFGNLLEQKEAVTNRILYTGQKYDQETGQYYLRARYYNPVVGRFLQEDTYRGDGLNLYAYCANNPVIYYDPSGHGTQYPDKVPETVDTPAGEVVNKVGSSSTTDRIRNVAQQSFDYAVNNPRKQGLNRMQLGKDAEIQATRWTRKWAERNGIDLSESGLHFQVRGEHSIPDVVYEPTKNIMDFKLTPKAVRKKQSDNFKSDFPGYSIEYIFGPGPWRE